MQIRSSGGKPNQSHPHAGQHEHFQQHWNRFREVMPSPSQRPRPLLVHPGPSPSSHQPTTRLRVWPKQGRNIHSPASLQRPSCPRHSVTSADMSTLVIRLTCGLQAKQDGFIMIFDHIHHPAICQGTGGSSGVSPISSLRLGTPANHESEMR
jgi:hypothetical protein